MNWFIVLLSLINLSYCIYEDQIGKFDWRQTYVGRIKFSQFDTVSTAKKIIVATEENVLAALNLKTGQVVWRHVFENAASGNIQLLHVSDKVVTVTGSNPYLVRGWDSSTGVLLWEWSMALENDEHADFSEWWVQQGFLVHMVPVFGSHVEVTLYNLMTGSNKGSTSKLSASWSNERCVFTAPYYTCPKNDNTLIALDIVSNAISNKLTNPIVYEIPQSINKLDSFEENSALPGFIINNNKVVVLHNNQFRTANVRLCAPSASVTVIDSSSGPLVLQIGENGKKMCLRAYNLNSGTELPDIRSDLTSEVPEPVISSALCTRKDGFVCRFVVTGADDSVHLMQQAGRILWSRDEALANVVAAEFVDLPVSELDAAIELQFDQKEGSIWSAFSRRLSTQFQQLSTLIQNLQNADRHTGEDQSSELVRDYFNLHKVLVLVTGVGKIFGLDNLSGAILWKRYEPAMDTENVVVFTRRSARHPPHEAYLTIVAKNEDSGDGLIVSLDPISGRLIGERVLKLDVALLQCAIVHTPDQENLHALLLLDVDENVQILPASAGPLVENLFVYVADRNTAKVQGYAIKYDGKSVIAQKTWSLNLGGSESSGHRIVKVVPKPPTEKSHSAGKVLGDRSVLYKYLNPNLVLFVTEGPDPVHKSWMVVAWCVDAAAGGVVTSQSVRRARASPAAVHADNLLAYTYWSERPRRLEIATIELYEGKQRWLPAGAAFSSLMSERAPIVETQTYIVPGAVTAAAVTTTQRSLTDTHVLMALTSGAIVELPWAYLEPRRPITPTAEQREEGLIPYAPELPLPSEAVINYNNTLYRINAIYTNPSGLESTSLVLATGLDMFYTRVAPSKTFDLLKDDFDYYLITIVLGALILSSYSTKYFASRKMLKLAWK